MNVDDDGLLRDLVWLTPAEAAARVHVSREAIYAWARAGSIRVLRHGRRLLVEEGSVMDHELAMRTAPSGRPRQGTTRGTGRGLQG